jgi:hypothetical protein
VASISRSTASVIDSIQSIELKNYCLFPKLIWSLINYQTKKLHYEKDFCHRFFVIDASVFLPKEYREAGNKGRVTISCQSK